MKAIEKIRLTTMAAFLPSTRESIQYVLKLEQTKATGRAVGLTDEDIKEVIDSWLSWYRSSPYPVDWNRISRALVDRWDGQEDWWPQSHLRELSKPVEPIKLQYGGPGYQPALTTYSKKRTSHGLHLFMTIITGGLWAVFIWLPITVWHIFGKKQKSVARYQ